MHQTTSHLLMQLVKPLGGFLVPVCVITAASGHAGGSPITTRSNRGGPGSPAPGLMLVFYSLFDVCSGLCTITVYPTALHQWELPMTSVRRRKCHFDFTLSISKVVREPVLPDDSTFAAVLTCYSTGNLYVLVWIASWTTVPFGRGVWRWRCRRPRRLLRGFRLRLRSLWLGLLSRL
jgi:hypothetical protein